MFHSLLDRKLASRARGARRVALIVSLFAVAALPGVNAGAWQQQKQLGGEKRGAASASIDTRQSEKPAAKAVAVKEPGAAQALTVCAQSQPIDFGQTISGSLANDDCLNPFRNARADEYTFNGTVGQQISISMSSSNFDTYLYLFRPDGSRLTENDDIDPTSKPPNRNSRIPPGGFFILPFSGTYSLLASSFAPEERGAYTLTLTASGNCSATPITYGETKQGSLADDDCLNPFRNARADEYTFNGTEGQQISISMSSSNFDTYLHLLGPDGSRLTENDDTNGSLNSRIPPNGFFILPSNGAYSILASSYGPSGRGAYTLTLNKSAYSISGQVTGSGVGLSGVTVTLSGGASATTTTDGSGNYSFAGLPSGNNYTITPTNTAQYSFTPQTVTALQAHHTVNFNGAPRIIISEFRFRGTAGATDEFVELYNQTDETINITGWTLVSGGTPLHMITSGSIPARSHYLITGAGYSLPTASDGALRLDIPDSAAVALFSNSSVFVSGTRIDAVGFSTADALYTEGGGLSPGSGITTDSEHAFVRKLTSGTLQDTDNNSADFVLVATDPLVVGNNAVLGAPGAENRTSPIQRNATITAALVDPHCSGFGATTSSCARVRTAEGANSANAAFGTLRIRRKFTNKTGANVTRLRFRVVDITTTPESGVADLRVVGGTGSFDVTDMNGNTVTIQRLTLEQPPTQPNGGGFNSTVAAGAITLGTPLIVDNSINVEFILGVMQNGNFRFLVNVEALP